MNKNENNALKVLKISDDYAFEELYNDHYDQLCMYLYSFTNEKEQIEDVVQDTFMQLWHKRKEINIKNLVKSYLYKMAYNRLIDTYRADVKKDKMLSLYSYTVKSHAIAHNDDHIEAHLSRLDLCICVLPPRCKQVFIANKILGRKHKEVAFDMNISIKTVEGHVSRAYKILKNCMVN